MPVARPAAIRTASGNLARCGKATSDRTSKTIPNGIVQTKNAETSPLPNPPVIETSIRALTYEPPKLPNNTSGATNIDENQRLRFDIADKDLVTCCLLQSCVDLPDCPFCLRGSDARMNCGANGTFTYTVTLQNLTGVPVQQIFVVPAQPASVAVTPQLITLSTPLPPNQTTTITITISGAAPGTRVCLRFSPVGGDNESTCCSIEICFTSPRCIP